MSSNSNSRTAKPGSPGLAQRQDAERVTRLTRTPSLMLPALPRRTALLGLTLLPLLGLSWLREARGAISPGLRRWGSGSFRRFGFLVYEATLWAGDDPHRPPLALRLDYKRPISGKLIAEASIKEMRRFIADETALLAWGETMKNMFPDVQAGDHLLGVYQTSGARFYHNDQSIGGIESPHFAAAFFAIWLDERTSAPDLRAALLMRQDG